MPGILIEILGNATQFKKELDGAVTATAKANTGFSKLSKAAGLVGVAVAGGVAIALDKSVKAAEDAQVQTARLADAFKTAGLSIKNYQGGIDQSEESARKLGFTNTDVRAALGRLVVATHDAKESFGDLSVAEDIARFKHIDLEAASKLLARAMTGSQRATKELGIEVQATTDAQDAAKQKARDQIAALNDQFGSLSKLTGAQRDQYDQLKSNIQAQEKLDLQDAKIQDHQVTGQKIIEETSKLLKGQAQAYSDTAQGGAAQFHAQMEALQEQLGNLLLPAITKVTQALANMASWLNDHGPEIRAVFNKIGDDAGPILKNLRDLTVAVYNAFHDNWDKIGPIVNNVGDAVQAFAKVIAAALRLIIDLIHGDWAAAWGDVKDIVGNALSAAKNVLLALSAPFREAAMALGAAVKQGVEAGVTGVGEWIKGTVDGIVDFWKEMPGRVADAITSGAGQVKDAIVGLFKDLPGAIKSLLGISSPSKVFMEIGHAIVQGVIHGIENIGPDLLDKAKGLFGSVAHAAGSALSGAAHAVGNLFGGGGGATDPVSIGQAMAAAYGWGSGAEWANLFALWQGESGWNPRARNPQSGAFGIPQALPASKMGPAAVAGDASAQIAWGLNYIKSVYGDPINAYQTWLSRSPHWYAEGGIFNRPTIIGVGEAGPEAVVPLTRGGLGGDIIVNIATAYGDPGDFARAIRKELAQMERRGTKLGFAGT